MPLARELHDLRCFPPPFGTFEVRSMEIRAFICTAIATAFLATIPASADSITYTATGFESGTIGTTTFNLAAVTVTITADTGGIVPSSIDPTTWPIPERRPSRLPGSEPPPFQIRCSRFLPTTRHLMGILRL